jgi:tetratricopeptide (TPR) repeat protein
MANDKSSVEVVLPQKPPSKRKRLIWIASVVVLLFLFVTWAYTAALYQNARAVWSYAPHSKGFNTAKVVDLVIANRPEEARRLFSKMEEDEKLLRQSTVSAVEAFILDGNELKRCRELLYGRVDLALEVTESFLAAPTRAKAVNAVEMGQKALGVERECNQLAWNDMNYYVCYPSIHMQFAGKLFCIEGFNQVAKGSNVRKPEPRGSAPKNETAKAAAEPAKASEQTPSDEKALGEIKKKAEAGDKAAAAQLGLRHFRLGNYAEAHKWLVEAIKDPDQTLAISALGSMYEQGLGVNKDLPIAYASYSSYRFNVSEHWRLHDPSKVEEAERINGQAAQRVWASMSPAERNRGSHLANELISASREIRNRPKAATEPMMTAVEKLQAGKTGPAEPNERIIALLASPKTEKDRQDLREAEKEAESCSNSRDCIFAMELRAARLIREGKAKTADEALKLSARK